MTSPRLNVLILLGCSLVFLGVPLHGIDSSMMSRYALDLVCQVLINIGELYTFLFIFFFTMMERNSGWSGKSVVTQSTKLCARIYSFTEITASIKTISYR